ncbi:endodeoxyribonuclease RusA [Psychrobacillus insolitus]|uniref:Endodeoxyribonuclease RusA n=1 Tax=Psychrobacillus insolitus TaxID=1461 RepID=A0A2W7MLF0_9BACI|nr:RusA family crossover junction endodeoxyribonuclease [Psychrobacillus insolitus]PZX07590.1 endodeoxyribonuclease RusA [Psychrobacillus insolitus]
MPCQDQRYWLRLFAKVPHARTKNLSFSLMQKGIRWLDHVNAEKHSALIESEVRLFLDIYRPIPKSISKNKREDVISGVLRPTKKPDLDNLVKGIKDGLSKVIWHDDAQIVEMNVRKFYSENPRAVVKVEW